MTMIPSLILICATAAGALTAHASVAAVRQAFALVWIASR